MKRIIIISSFCLLLLSAGLLPNSQPSSLAKSPLVSEPNSSTVDHGGKIETKYDGFTHETVVMLKQMRVNCGGVKGSVKQTCVSLIASLHCPGKQLEYVRYAKLQLVFETKDWDKRHPLEERDLFVVADGKTLRLGRMGLVNQNVAGDWWADVMKEVLEIAVSYKTFETIAQAQTVEIKVGKSAFALQQKNLEALGDLSLRVKF
ncbi:MAG: hypothetical protein ND895_02615 [Pyrinomonadaceae bacterium]|nr:hypothetical protein [Pyrinomonadaceae bacterium]